MLKCSAGFAHTRLHNSYRFYIKAVITLLFLMTTLLTVFWKNAEASNPVINDLSDNTISELSGAEVCDFDITFSDGDDYADGYLRYSLSDATADDTFFMISDSDDEADGAISTDGTYVFLGNGSGKIAIATIDSTEDGFGGQPLKVLFYRSVDNGGFESGDTSDWTVSNTQYPGDGALDGDTIPWKRLTNAGNGLTGTGEISIGTENSMSYAVAVDTTVVSSGTYSLRLQSSGTIIHSNTGTPTVGSNPESGYGSIHGPYVECTPFTAYNNDLIYMDWSAVHTSDWYEVLGYLVASGNDGTFSDGNETEILLFKKRGDEQGWTTVAVPITSDDTYKFRFVSGTYDATGGKAVGAYLYIDNIRIVTGVAIDDAVLTNIARHITFENTADLSADLVRNLTVSVETNSMDTASEIQSLTITTVVDPTPFISGNNGLTLDEAATATLSAADLSASDIDTYDENLIYSITSSPDSGHFENTDDPGTAITTFTQQAITENKIVFVHNGSETPSDSFSFSVSDGIHEITDQLFQMSVTAVNDAPVVDVNVDLRLSRSGTVPIISDYLVATDADNDNLALVFTITANPSNGRIENSDAPGTPVTTFPQQDIVDEKIRYVHDGGETSSDSFVFKVSDGTAEVSGQTFNIVPGENDEPQATLRETPFSLTNATSYTIRVGGNGVVSYRYRLDDETAWQPTTDISTAITFDLSTEGEHTLYVVGKDGSDTWQEGVDATTYSWMIDTTPPVAVICNAPQGTIGNHSAVLKIRGQDEAAVAFKYNVNGSGWSPLRYVDTSVSLSGLGDGSYTVQVLAMDAAGNWQPESGATQAEWVVDSEEYGLALGGLPDTYTTETSAVIAVSGDNVVTGDKVVAYVYSLDNGTWTYGEVPAPVTLTALSEGEHGLRIRGLTETGDVADTGDGAYTLSWIVDTTAAQTTDLAATAGVPEASSVDLSWTWSSDSSSETIERYQVWYSTEPITETNLENATEVYCDRHPAAEGDPQRFTIKQLQPETLYYFAVKVRDMAGNISGLSNIAEQTTADTLPSVTGLSLISGGTSADNSAGRDITVTGAGFVGIAGDNIIRFENEYAVVDIENGAGTDTELTAAIPVGVPVGTYSVRVLNKYGRSLPLSAAYTVTAAAVAVPEVTDLSPRLIATDTTETLIISGAHFTSPLAGAWIVAADGTRTALTIMTEASEEEITASLTIPSGFPAGRYHVRVENSNNLANAVSSVQIEIAAPSILATLSDPVVTSGIVVIDNGTVPVRTVLITDSFDEVEPVNPFPAAISLEIPSGMVLEGMESPYSGQIVSPRELPLSSAVRSETGNYSIEFSIGGESTLYSQNEETMLLTIEISIPADAPAPSLYRIDANGLISKAGISGTINGIEYSPGGTIRATRKDTPESGYTTITISALITRLDTHYAVGAGSQGKGRSHSSCFINTVEDSIKPTALLAFLFGCLPVCSTISIVLVFFYKKQVLICHQRTNHRRYSCPTGRNRSDAEDPTKEVLC